MNENQEHFLINADHVFWKFVVFLMFIGIGFILSTGLING